MYTTSSPVSVGALDPTSMLRLLPIAVCVLGLLMVFREVLFLGGAVQLNDAADPRFNEFLLEHSWRWLQGFEAGGVFELSVGYPSTNTLGYSEPMISFGPLYWPFRALGLSTATSYSYWLVTTAVVNFFCFYFFTRKSLGLGIVAACVSAFLFAFGLPRVAQIGHSQLWPQFYVVLILWGMYVLFLGAATERTQRIGAVAVIGGLVLQAWGCLYNAIFVGYLCLVTVTFALLHPAWRANALRTLRVVTPVALCCLVCGDGFCVASHSCLPGCGCLDTRLGSSTVTRFAAAAELSPLRVELELVLSMDDDRYLLRELASAPRTGIGYGFVDDGHRSLHAGKKLAQAGGAAFVCGCFISIAAYFDVARASESVGRSA